MVKFFVMWHATWEGERQRERERVRERQDKQGTNNVILRHVAATTVTVEKQQLLHILSVCL